MGFFDTVIVQPIFNLLLFIYNFLGDFGVSVIIFTIIIKFALWPLMKRQLHQTKIIKKIQPELAEIKVRCKGNRQMESLQMMDLYKRNNVKPLRSMLVAVIQLPIIIALFRVISMTLSDGANVEKYAYGFIKSMPKISDLISNFDQFQPNLFGVVNLENKALPIVGWSSVVILLMAVAAMFLQFYAHKQQTPNKKVNKKFKDIMKEAADGKEANQSEINGIVSEQMSKMLPIMTLLIMINMPGALALYYLITNAVTVVQQKIIFKKDVDEMEETADKKLIKEVRDTRKIKEGKIVENKKSKENVTRITASDKKRRKR